MSGDDYVTVSAWASDFTRALIDRPWIFRILFKLIVGKYAYREFVGMQDELMRSGMLPFFQYSLREMDYHKDPVPFDFGKEREPQPKKVGLS